MTLAVVLVLNVVLGLASVVAAPSASAARRPKPCTLLEPREITEAFGQPTGEGSDELGATFCQWDLAASPDRARGQVNVFVVRGKAATRNYKLVAKTIE